MLIRVPKAWEIPECEASPDLASLDRRRFLAAAGQLAVGTAVAGLAGCGNAPRSPKQAAIAVAAPPADIARLYPARRNPRFALDRPVSPEKVVASYNNYYEFGEGKDDPAVNAQKLTIRPWAVQISGLVEKPFQIDRDDLVRKIGLEERLYRHRCVEAWSIAVPWTGFPLRKLVDLARPLSSATYLRVVSFKRPREAPSQLKPWYPWPYFEGYRMDEAVHELAFVAVGSYRHELPKQNGAPIRLAMPWKYGYKSAKGIVKFDFTDEQPATFWNALQPLEYGFLSNVNPEVPNPRWSQATEKFFGPNGVEVRPTLPYNGYAELVAGMYSEETRRRIS